MDFKREKIFFKILTLRLLVPSTLDLGLKLVKVLALAHLTPIVHWLLKGGNTTLNYLEIANLNKGLVLGDTPPPRCSKTILSRFLILGPFP